jgi:cyclophilin family peptidyl-prolyl cis-trans isomerase
MLFRVLLGVLALGLFAMATPAEDKKPDAPKKEEPKKNELKNEAVNPIVIIDTNFGAIEVELFADKAPKTVANFLAYTDDKFYDGLIFHRVMSTFMIQGGGFEPGLKKKDTKEAIKNEADNNLSNTEGTIAMARTQEADSATSQFFINTADNSKKLDKAHVEDKVGYCVFGKVVAGSDVVAKIKEVKCEANPFNKREISSPIEDIVIKSIKRKK